MKGTKRQHEHCENHGGTERPGPPLHRKAAETPLRVDPKGKPAAAGKSSRDTAVTSDVPVFASLKQIQRPTREAWWRGPRRGAKGCFAPAGAKGSRVREAEAARDAASGGPCRSFKCGSGTCCFSIAKALPSRLYLQSWPVQESLALTTTLLGKASQTCMKHGKTCNICDSETVNNVNSTRRGWLITSMELHNHLKLRVPLVK